jgi:hypothetical protein
LQHSTLWQFQMQSFQKCLVMKSVTEKTSWVFSDDPVLHGFSLLVCLSLCTL